MLTVASSVTLLIILTCFTSNTVFIFSVTDPIQSSDELSTVSSKKVRASLSITLRRSSFWISSPLLLKAVISIGLCQLPRNKKLLYFKIVIEIYYNLERRLEIYHITLKEGL